LWQQPSELQQLVDSQVLAAGLLAGGCGILWELNPQQQLVDSQVLDC